MPSFSGEVVRDPGGATVPTPPVVEEDGPAIGLLTPPTGPAALLPGEPPGAPPGSAAPLACAGAPSPSTVCPLPGAPVAAVCWTVVPQPARSSTAPSATRLRGLFIPCGRHG